MLWFHKLFAKIGIKTRKYQRRVVESHFPYSVEFDAEPVGKYRFRYDTDKHDLQLIYENGEKHKTYTFT